MTALNGKSSYFSLLCCDEVAEFRQMLSFTPPWHRPCPPPPPPFPLLWTAPPPPHLSPVLPAPLGGHWPSPASASPLRRRATSSSASASRSLKMLQRFRSNVCIAHVWGGVLNASPSPTQALPSHRTCTMARVSPHQGHHSPHHTTRGLSPCERTHTSPSSQSHGMRSPVGAVAGLTSTLPTGPLTCQVGVVCERG